MTDQGVRRSALPTMEEAIREIETKPLTSAAVIAVFTNKSLLTIYAALRDGSIPSMRVGAKYCVATGPYRRLLAA